MRRFGVEATSSNETDPSNSHRRLWLPGGSAPATRATRRRRTPKATTCSQIQAASRGDSTPRSEASRTSRCRPTKMNEFLPLKYFPPDPEYVVPAALKPATGTNRRRDADVDRQDSEAAARRRARVHAQGPAAHAWRIRRSRRRLNRLFVPFSDMTSGTETYAAGRYLELDRTATGVYTIDFNKAYNP